MNLSIKVAFHQHLFWSFVWSLIFVQPFICSLCTQCHIIHINSVDVVLNDIAGSWFHPHWTLLLNHAVLFAYWFAMKNQVRYWIVNSNCRSNMKIVAPHCQYFQHKGNSRYPCKYQYSRIALRIDFFLPASSPMHMKMLVLSSGYMSSLSIKLWFESRLMCAIAFKWLQNESICNSKLFLHQLMIAYYRL